MTTTITRLFDSYDLAGKAVSDLEANGIAHSDISLVSSTPDAGSTAPATEGTEASTGAGTGATLGTVVGGGTGLLAGLGMLAIPGIGPVVAAGWLVATALGAGVGAASGGLLGSLVGAGVSETDAHVYAEGVRRGGTLVTVRAEEEQVGMVEGVLDRYAPVDPAARADEYRSGGWSRFDEEAPAYTSGAAPVATARTPLP